MCKKIYMPVLSDAVSQCKVAQFENLVRIWDYPQILEKTEKINPLDGFYANWQIDGITVKDAIDFVKKKSAFTVQSVHDGNYI